MLRLNVLLGRLLAIALFAILLFDRDSVVAIKADRERSPVSCWGDLVKDNYGFLLKNVRDFKVDDFGLN